MNNASSNTSESQEIDGECSSISGFKTIILIPVSGRRDEIMLKESPRYPRKWKRWMQCDELTHKNSLEVLLYECRTVTNTAHYLNCTRQQIYHAMEFHGISRTAPRSYYPDELKRKLRLQ